MYMPEGLDGTLCSIVDYKVLYTTKSISYSYGQGLIMSFDNILWHV